MTYSQIVVFVAAFLVPIQLIAQTKERDQQALMILTQTVNAVGGLDLLKGVNDFAGRGMITYYLEDEVRGAVIVRGHGRTKFRLDASLPNGMRSIVMNKGACFIKETDGTIRSVLANTRMAETVFPYGELIMALNEPATSIAYIGLVKRHGRLAHEIRIRYQGNFKGDGRKSPNSAKVNYFIDPNTFLISSVVDTAGPRIVADAHDSHEIEFADYHPSAGILVPFSITEKIHGQHLFTMALSEIFFNTHISDAEFVP